MKKLIFFFKSWFTISIVIFAILLYLGKMRIDAPFTLQMLWKHYVAAAIFAMFGAPVSLLLRQSLATIQEKYPYIAIYFYTIIAINAVGVTFFIVKELISMQD